MPAAPIIDISDLDFENPKAGQETIEKINPHRGHMRHLDAVAHWDRKQGVGWKNVHEDEFWVAGHIPGRPLLPGVLMVEAAAQLSSFIVLMADEDDGTREASPFLGFTRCDDTAFRGQVAPGDRLVLIADLLSKNKRRFVSRCQGFVEGRLTFETKITGMRM